LSNAAHKATHVEASCLTIHDFDSVQAEKEFVTENIGVSYISVAGAEANAALQILMWLKFRLGAPSLYFRVGFERKETATVPMSYGPCGTRRCGYVLQSLCQ